MYVPSVGKARHYADSYKIIYRGLSVTLPPLGDVLLISSYCGGCRSSINEPDFGSEIKGHGVRYNFRVSHPDDLERAVLKSKTATLSIGNTLYQLPPGRGRLTTIEGLLSDLVKTWENGQKQRKQDNPGAWKMIYDTVQPLISMANGAKLPFTISLDDPTGNSCIEASEKDNLTDGKYAYSQYARTSEQNAKLANRKNEYDDEMEGEPYKRTAEYEDLVRAQLDDGKPLIDIKGKGKA